MSIMSSFMIVITLAVLIAHILSRALKRDFITYELLRMKQQEKLKNFKKRIQKNKEYN